MRVIDYTNKWSANIFRLFYATCTNDLVVNSKQASVIEDFLFAFCIEFNRLFIADSLLINEVRKHLIVKVKAHCNNTKTLFKINWLEIKKAILELFKTKNDYSFLHEIILFEKAILKEAILKFISTVLIFQNNQIFSFRSLLISANDRVKTFKIDYI